MTGIIRVVDTETTGLERSDEVVEIAAIDVKLDSERPDFFGSYLVRPTKPIPPEASAVHHITDDDVAKAKFWPDAQGDIFYPGGMEGVVAVAAHKADFDGMWITPEIRRNVPLICTWKCSLRRWPEMASHSNQALRYALNLNIDWTVIKGCPSAPHRAPYDALVTSYLLIELLKNCTMEQLIAWSAEPALMPKCPIGEHRGKPWETIDKGFLDWCLTKKDMDGDIIWNVKRELKRREDTSREAYTSAAVLLIDQAITIEDLRCWFAWEADVRAKHGIYPNTEWYARIVEASKKKAAELPPAIPKPEAA